MKNILYVMTFLLCAVNKKNNEIENIRVISKK